jgi:hypothetical protein
VTDNTLALRAAEIIHNSQGSINARDAVKKALLERFHTMDELADAYVTAATALMSQLRRSTYDVPDELALFDIPAVIAINTPNGVLFIHRNDAELGQVRQWGREGLQYHAGQHLRFKRINEDLSLIEGEPDELKWTDARTQLQAVKKAELQ